jgi:hypothetical protein
VFIEAAVAATGWPLNRVSTQKKIACGAIHSGRYPAAILWDEGTPSEDVELSRHLKTIVRDIPWHVPLRPHYLNLQAVPCLHRRCDSKRHAMLSITIICSF